MIKHHSDFLLEVTGHDVRTIEADLNSAVDIARTYAMQEGRNGILVTRNNFTSYTVAVSGDVPYGETRERR